MTQFNRGYESTPSVGVATAVIEPKDRVRWGPILAGIFTALSTLLLLSVLGAAIGCSAYDPGDQASAFGIGAGIWGVISMIAAFLIGGWLAARTAALGGHSNGLPNGAMVWAVGIPLTAMLLGSTAMSGANIASNAADQMSANTNQPRQASAQIGDVSVDASQVNSEEAADRAASTAWWTLLALVLG